MKNPVTSIRELVGSVLDPEVPALTISDLGILRDVRESETGIEIVITPTFTGCPAMKAIEDDIRQVLNEAAITGFSIKTVYAPAWTTDWITEEGKRKLREYGIAPPTLSTEQHLKSILTGKREPVHCPFCNAADTRLTSPFGSTACKALHYCNNCHQPFEEFKCH